MLEHPRWEVHSARQPARRDDRLDAGAAAAGRRHHAARRAGAAGVRRDRDLPRRVYTRLSGDWRRPGSTGLPGLVCNAKIVDEGGSEVAAGIPGEVVVRGPSVFFEYWGDAEATAEALRDGWYRSGDVGMRDADGHFFIHDRKKNLIISGGENIYPAEVERVLHAHPAVAEAAVIGQPDARWQEVPVAYLVRRAGTTATMAEIEGFCLQQLARYKVPRAFVLVESLPRNAMGKVQQKADENRRSGRWQWLVGGGR